MLQESQAGFIQSRGIPGVYLDAEQSGLRTGYAWPDIEYVSDRYLRLGILVCAQECRALRDTDPCMAFQDSGQAPEHFV